jgi:PIN domain nuclease of toxin-antitoxin system
VRLLVDTVTFIWAIGAPDRISARASRAVQLESTVVEISAISLSEIAIKQGKGKLNLSKVEVLTALDQLKLRVLPYTAAHASELFGLPLHHEDPFDRQITAQALAEDIPIVTADETFRLYKGLRVIW